MKKKTSLKEIIFFIIPCIIHTLCISPLYAVLGKAYNDYMSGETEVILSVFKGYTGIATGYENAVVADPNFSTKPIEYFYLVGLSFFIVLCLFSVALKFCKQFWQFPLIAIGTTIASFFVFHCIIYTILLAIIAFCRILSRYNKSEGIFGKIHWAQCFFFLVYFIIFGISTFPFLQYVTCVSVVIFFALYFVYSGFDRFYTYVDINKKMANMPSSLILKANKKLYLILGIAILCIFTPIVAMNFQYVPIEIPQLGGNEPPTLSPPKEHLNNGGSDGVNLSGLTGVEAWDGWDYFGYAIVAVFAVFAVKAGWKIVKEIIKNYSKEERINDDVIEYISDEEDGDNNDVIERKKMKKSISFFDNSPNAVFRKKYVKAVKKRQSSRPEKWQTPEEIENSNNLNVPLLHQLYEKARYSQFGCNKEDVSSFQGK